MNRTRDCTGNRWLRRIGCGLLLAVLAAPVLADTILTRDGRNITGKFAGGTQAAILFQTGNEVVSLPVSEIASIMFDAALAAAPQTPPAPPVPVPQPPAAAPPAPTGPVTIPAGSVLMVAMTDQVTSKDAAGRRFSGKMAADLSAGGTVIAPKGTLVYGRVDKSAKAGRLAGKSQLELQLTEIEIRGTLYPIMTTNFAETGKGSFRKTARNAGVGALIGAAVDDDGAGKGAAVGVGVSLIREGDSVTVPAGAVLEFRITQPLTVTK